MFGPLTLRPMGNRWWALNRREEGWASFGFQFPSLRAALTHFRATVDDAGIDAHGLYLVAVPAEVRS